MNVIAKWGFLALLLCCAQVNAQSTQDLAVPESTWEFLEQKIESEFTEIPSSDYTRCIVAILVNDVGDVLKSKTMNHPFTIEAETQLLDVVETMKVENHQTNQEASLIYLCIEFVNGEVQIEEVKS